MKKKIAVLAVVVIALSLVAYGTVAYFSAEGTAHNILTMGSVKIELSDKTLVEGEGGVQRDFTEVYPNGMPVMPASQASKIVYVTNTGSNPCWVRVKVDVAAEAADPANDPLDIDMVHINFDQENWLKGNDGYWYYKDILGASQVTEELFTQVAFDKDMGNDYMNCQFSITVSAEAVQSDNNGVPENGTVLDVWNANNQ